MNDQQRNQLDGQGYLIFKNVLSPSDIESILSRLEELWSVEGDQSGEENYIEAGVRRLANRRQHVDPDHAAALSPRERELLGLDDKEIV